MDTAAARVLQEDQMQSLHTSVECDARRESTNRLSSNACNVVNNGDKQTHCPRGKYVNVKASLRVIRELVDALLDDQFDFEKGEIKGKISVENEETYQDRPTSTYDFRKNLSRRSRWLEKSSDSENSHVKNDQQRPTAKKDIPHTSFEESRRINVQPPSRRGTKHERVLISATKRSSSYQRRQEQTVAERQAPEKFRRICRHRRSKSLRPGHSHSDDCSFSVSTNNNNRNGDLRQDERMSNQEFQFGSKQNVPEFTSVLDAGSLTVQRLCSQDHKATTTIKPRSCYPNDSSLIKPSRPVTNTPLTMTSRSIEQNGKHSKARKRESKEENKAITGADWSFSSNVTMPPAFVGFQKTIDVFRECDDLPKSKKFKSAVPWIDTHWGSGKVTTPHKRHTETSLCGTSSFFSFHFNNNNAFSEGCFANNDKCEKNIFLQCLREYCEAKSPNCENPKRLRLFDSPMEVKQTNCPSHEDELSVTPGDTSPKECEIEENVSPSKGGGTRQEV